MRKPTTPMRYSRVTRRIWHDKAFTALSAPAPNAQTLLIRLLTAPELTILPGVAILGRRGLAEAMRWPDDDFDRCFAELEAAGMARADWDARLVWLPKALAHNEPENPSQVRAWAKALRELPDSPLRDHIRGVLYDFCHGRGKRWLDALNLVPTKSPNPSGLKRHRPEPHGAPHGVVDGLVHCVPDGEPHQEQEQEQKRDDRDASASSPRRAKTKLEPISDERVDGLIGLYRELHGKDDRWSPEAKEGAHTRAAHILRALDGTSGDRLSADEIALAFRGNASNPWHKEKGKHEISYILRPNKVYEFITEGRKHDTGEPVASPIDMAKAEHLAATIAFKAASDALDRGSMADRPRLLSEEETARLRAVRAARLVRELEATR